MSENDEKQLFCVVFEQFALKASKETSFVPLLLPGTVQVRSLPLINLQSEHI